MMRIGPAPSETRIAVSFPRAVARASSSPATLPQAISRTKPAAPISTQSGVLASPTVSSRRGLRMTVKLKRRYG